MKQMQMEAKMRTTLGKGPAGRMRVEKVIPAVMYGRKENNLNLELSGKQLQQMLVTPSLNNVLITLSITGGEQPKQETVMIKEIQRHPVSMQAIHVDFVKIAMDQPLQTKIPVILVGNSPGVKEGGVLELIHREVNIRCLPSLIPENFTLDISQLKIGDAIMVTALPAAEGIEILVDAHEPIVHVVAPRVEEEKPAAEAAVVGAAAAAPEAKQPEVIGEKEREERRTAKTKEETKK